MIAQRLRWREGLESRGSFCSASTAAMRSSCEAFGSRICSLIRARLAAYFFTVLVRRFSRSIMLVFAIGHFLNGKLNASSNALPDLSSPAVVVIVMSMPRSWSIWSYAISGKMICSLTPKL